MLGKTEGRRSRGRQRRRWLDGITDSMDMGLGELRESVMDRDPLLSGGRKEWDTTERLENSRLYPRKCSLRSLFVRRVRKRPCVLTLWLQMEVAFCNAVSPCPASPSARLPALPGLAGPRGSLVGPREREHRLQAVLSQVPAFPRARLRPSCPGFSSCCFTEIDVPIDLRWVSQGISGLL